MREITAQKTPLLHTWGLRNCTPKQTPGAGQPAQPHAALYQQEWGRWGWGGKYTFLPNLHQLGTKAVSDATLYLSHAGWGCHRNKCDRRRWQKVAEISKRDKSNRIWVGLTREGGVCWEAEAICFDLPIIRGVIEGKDSQREEGPPGLLYFV